MEVLKNSKQEEAETIRNVECGVRGALCYLCFLLFKKKASNEIRSRFRTMRVDVSFTVVADEDGTEYYQII